MYLVAPSPRPRLDNPARMPVTVSASEKSPYSVVVRYLTMITVPTKPKSMPITVPMKIIPVPFAIFWSDGFTISDKVSLFIFRERMKGKMFSSVSRSILVLVYRGARKERRESGNYLSSFFSSSQRSPCSQR